MPRNRFWMQVMGIVSDGLFMVASDGRICEVNQALCDLSGYSREELIGQSCTILACDACAGVREEAGGAWCRLFAQKLIITRNRCHIRHKSGRRIPVLKNARLLQVKGEEVPEGIFSGDVQPPFGGGPYTVETVTDIRELTEKEAYIQQVERLLHPKSGFEGMVGTSASMLRIYRIVEQAARSTAPVLILGESGTGKELVAQALHRLSPRARFPFEALNCAALNEQILESELFGHVKGAFTGALRDRIGRFEAAHGGTLFLDEIGDIPLPMQVKILRTLETGVIQMVGDNRSRTVDVRIISATNRSLPELIEKGQFREDLAFRINVIPISLPPLRERCGDIPLLVAHFLRNLRDFSDSRVHAVAPEVQRLFQGYAWPGNVRELRNVLEYGTVMCRGEVLEREHLPEHMQAAGQASGAQAVLAESPVSPSPRSDAVPAATAPASRRQETQRAELCQALEQTGGNVTQAARLLGIHRTTCINRMLRLGLTVSREVRRNQP